MAEEKNQDWRPEIKRILGEENKPIQDKLKSIETLLSGVETHIYKQESGQKPPGNSEGHKNLKDQIDCPDCYPKILNAVVSKEFKGAEAECTECGLPVRKERAEKEEWECPSCKNKFARVK